MSKIKNHYHDKLEKMARGEHRLSKESIDTIRTILEERIIEGGFRVVPLSSIKDALDDLNKL